MTKKNKIDSIEIVEFDPINGSEEEWQRYFEYRRKKLLEKDPNDPISSDESAKNSIQQNVQTSDMEIHLYSVIDTSTNKQVGDAMHAIILENSPSYEGTKHLAQFDIYVLQAYRRNGIGKKLLMKVYDYAKGIGKSLLVTGSSCDAGKGFLNTIGAQLALSGVDNRLNLKEVDWSMVETWAKEGPKRSPNTALKIVHKMPDEILEAYSKVYTEVVNQQPLGDLDVGAIVFTPESYRVMEDRFERMGRKWITMYAQESDGKISGLTEVFYNPALETFISQNMTGVQEEFRGRGIGKWLKAAMLLHIQDNYPKIEIITTGNATSNAPMLSINNRLGFKVYKESHNAQVTMEQLTKYLDSK